ncbi:AAA family ATPase [Actinomadura roseirufa]|uniref:AAA family ATPase n=1 Tax=Actinomadura roseirufa TaxID=2094049 RepID=UPI00104139ED|nr:MoxR family ATPase [Actinomadura roseirufa]
MSANEPPAHVGAHEREEGGHDRDGTWPIYRGTGLPRPGFSLPDVLPDPPPWRAFNGGPLQPPPPRDHRQLRRRLGSPGPVLGIDDAEIDAVNAALYLRRPLLVLGRPGVGKSTLAYKISSELGLGRVLRWPIGSRSTLRGGLYDYDAIGRAQETVWRDHGGALARPGPAGARDGVPAPSPPPDAASIGDFIHLGPLGTALLPYRTPRVLLIDELDKGDEDLPNDLLDVFEEGSFTVPELVRAANRAPQVTVHTADPGGRAVLTGGQVECRAFPLIVITSNGEREFPPALLRRCLRFELTEPSPDRLADMIAGHLGRRDDEEARALLVRFLRQRETAPELSGDQLMNAVYLATSGRLASDDSLDRVLDLLWRRLTMARAVPE